MFRVTYKGVAYVFRLIEEVAIGANRIAQAANRDNDRLARVLAGMNQQDYSTRSAMEMERMLQQGKGFCQFDLMERDYKTFYDAAMAAGVRFSCVTLDKIHEPGNRLFTIFCSPDQADIVNRIIEINELNGVKSADYQQESAREVTPAKSHDITEDELRRQNQGRNADFYTQFIDEVQPRTQNPTMRAGQESATPSGPPSTFTGNGRRSVKERVLEIRRNRAAPQPSKEEIAQSFYQNNLKNLSVSTRE